MAKIRTTNQIQDTLDNEFSWRVQEIAELKSAVQTSSQIQERILIRAGVPLAYAHWEGFVKTASGHYVEYVSHQKISFRKLHTSFIVRGLKRKLDELSASSNYDRNASIVEFIKDSLDKKLKIPYKGVINTQSNLSSEVLKQITQSIGIDYNPYQTKKQFIDEVVLKNRNSIAHGRRVDMGKERFLSMSDDVIGLLRMYKTDIENAVVLESYKHK